MKNSSCYVCSSTSLSTIYRSIETWSLTSTCQQIDGVTHVEFCSTCGHVQTESILDENNFYEEEYQILTDSFEEDQFICDSSGKTSFRNSTQTDWILESLNLNPGSKVLDFGSAKGATAFQIQRTREDWNISLFDHSSCYESFWEKHLCGFETASCNIPDDWHGTFDAVVSCYVLEHIFRLNETLDSIRSLLKDDGNFLFIVPNPFENVADVLVVDHVNHFTLQSLKYLLFQNGFEIDSIDSNCIPGAWSVVAKKSSCNNHIDEKSSKLLKEECYALGKFWEMANAALLDFEELTNHKPTAIYGAGFYGAHIHNSLKTPENVEYFLDGNPFRQGNTFFGKPIHSPEELSERTRFFYAGLNPKVSRQIIPRSYSEKSITGSLGVFHFDAHLSYRKAVA